METQYYETNPLRYAYRIHPPCPPTDTHAHAPQYYRPLIMHYRGPDCRQEALRKAQDQLTPETTRYKTFEVGSLIWLEGTNLK